MHTNNKPPETFCQLIVWDIQDIMAQINRYLHMKNLSSTVDIFFYVERSIRAQLLCGQLTPKDTAGNPLYDELVTFYNTVKARWQHDYRLIATPVSLYPCISSENVSASDQKIIL